MTPSIMWIIDLWQILLVAAISKDTVASDIFSTVRNSGKRDRQDPFFRATAMTAHGTNLGCF
jgi:hypothetical protein